MGRVSHTDKLSSDKNLPNICRDSPAQVGRGHIQMSQVQAVKGLQSAGRLPQHLLNHVRLDFENLEAGPVVRHQQDPKGRDSEQGRQVLMLRQPQRHVRSTCLYLESEFLTQWQFSQGKHGSMRHETSEGKKLAEDVKVLQAARAFFPHGYLFKILRERGQVFSVFLAWLPRNMRLWALLSTHKHMISFENLHIMFT